MTSIGVVTARAHRYWIACIPLFGLSAAGSGWGCQGGESDDSSSQSDDEKSSPDDGDSENGESDSGDESPDSDDESSETSPEDDADDPSESEDPGDDSKDEDDPSQKFDLEIPEWTPDSDGECECAENSDMIYTLDNQGRLAIFNTLTNEFIDLGEFDCPSMPGETSMSLGVDRSSNAWVHVRPTGRIFKVETLNENKCTDSGFVPNPGELGFTTFGMAFVEHPNDGRCEQLYMHAADGNEWSQGPGVGAFGTLDPETMVARKIGNIDYNGGEMTGTQDGRVFALAGNPPELIEYSPQDASVVERTPLEGINLTGAFAFAFWGGDFYFFTDDVDNLVFLTKVTKLDYDGTGEMEVLVERTDRRVVGAGVSVCAPLVPPK